MTLPVIIEWYQGLPKRARENLSLHNLHDLSKRLGNAAPGDGGDGVPVHARPGTTGDVLNPSSPAALAEGRS